jgi:hypothetical protein
MPCPGQLQTVKGSPPTWGPTIGRRTLTRAAISGARPLLSWICCQNVMLGLVKGNLTFCNVLQHCGLPWLQEPPPPPPPPPPPRALSGPANATRGRARMIAETRLENISEGLSLVRICCGCFSGNEFDEITLECTPFYPSRTTPLTPRTNFSCSIPHDLIFFSEETKCRSPFSSRMLFPEGPVRPIRQSGFEKCHHLTDFSPSDKTLA